MGSGVGKAEGVGDGATEGGGEGERGVGEEVGMLELMMIKPLPDHTPWLFCRIVQPVLTQ